MLRQTTSRATVGKEKHANANANERQENAAKRRKRNANIKKGTAVLDAAK